jgi:tyrosine-protein phosphatase SIW14
MQVGMLFRYAGVLLLVGLIAYPPFWYFRQNYAHAKRLREVTAGRFYRSGQLTEAGLREAFTKYGIKTIINMQHENPDPLLAKSPGDKSAKVTESAVCKEMGVRYELLPFEPFPREMGGDARPPVIDRFLKIMDEPSVYPVLIHCKAGLHRTGELTAIYRMEYEGWSKAAVCKEIKANGFGDSACTTADDFIYQFLAKYQVGIRREAPPVDWSKLNATPPKSLEQE